MRICKYRIVVLLHQQLPLVFSNYFLFKAFTLILLISVMEEGFCQTHSKLKGQRDFKNFEEVSNGGVDINDSVSVSFSPNTCKNPAGLIFLKKVPSMELPDETAFKKKDPMIKIHGNILYEFSYRSYIDTPFAQNNLVQNLVQTNLNILIKNRYPVNVIISHRNSNSPYFKDVTDVNVSYNRSLLLNNIKEDLKNKTLKIPGKNSLTSLVPSYLDHEKQIGQLEEWINSPARIQEIIEEKERNLRGANYGLRDPKSADNKIFDDEEFKEDNFFGKERKFGFRTGIMPFSLNNPDSLLMIYKDGLASTRKAKMNGKDSSCVKKLQEKKEELKKLLAEANDEKSQITKTKKTVEDSLNQVQKELSGITNSSDLYAFMKRNRISKDSLSKGQKLLLSIDQINVGRTFIDYSELTVKNISLTGVNAEGTFGNLYLAACAGKINYLFRDFILKNDYSAPPQSLYALRAGIGKKEKNNFIATFYNGRKASLNTATNTSASVLEKILGISLESRLAINPNNYIIAEAGKSSFNNPGSAPSTSDLLKRAFDLKVHSNEAYSVKFFSENPATDTRVTGYYKKMGENFQSFNLYPVNVNQASWAIKGKQYLWKRTLLIDAAIRKNDFLSTVAIPSTFSSRTIFKSIQATLRTRKLLLISIGYYPTSQLSLSDRNVLTENQYNTLNAVTSYSYQVKKTSMNTNVVFTKFYNASSDTGFIYFNASSYTINHSIFLSLFTLQSDIAVVKEQDLNMFTIEQSVSYQIKNTVSLTGGLKWNKVNKKQNLYGGTAAIAIYLKKLGTVQINYDKSYLPGYNRNLKPVDTGRLSFYRDF